MVPMKLVGYVNSEKTSISWDKVKQVCNIENGLKYYG